MGNIIREEQDIFNELSGLCAQPGYIHVLAYLCWYSNCIIYKDRIKADDLVFQYSDECLIRTEISTLIGLMLKNEIDYSILNPSEIQKMLDKTQALLKEIHNSLSMKFKRY